MNQPLYREGYEDGTRTAGLEKDRKIASLKAERDSQQELKVALLKENDALKARLAEAERNLEHCRTMLDQAVAATGLPCDEYGGTLDLPGAIKEIKAALARANAGSEEREALFEALDKGEPFNTTILAEVLVAMKAITFRKAFRAGQGGEKEESLSQRLSAAERDGLNWIDGFDACVKLRDAKEVREKGEPPKNPGELGSFIVTPTAEDLDVRLGSAKDNEEDDLNDPPWMSQPTDGDNDKGGEKGGGE